MKRGILWAGLFLALPAALWSQAPKETKLSYLYEKATSYPGLSAKTEGIEAALLHKEITKRDYFPQILLQAQNSFSTYEGASGAFIPLPGILNVGGDGRNGHHAVNTLASMTLQWDFLQFGEHTDRIKIEELAQESAQNDYELKAVEVKYRLTADFLGWLNAKYVKAWADNEIKRNESLVNLSKGLVQSGLAPAADSLLAKSTLKQTSSKARKWKAKIRSFENKISEITGVQLMDKNLSQAFLSTAAEFLPENETMHPLLIAKDKENKKLHVKEKNTAHQVLPNLSILAGGLLRGESFRDKGDAWADTYQLDTKNYLVGIGLTWDISAFYSQGPKKKRYRHKQRQVEQERQAVQRSLNEQEESSKYQIEQALREIDDAETAYKAAKTAYDQFKIRYKNGLIDLASLLQIQQSLQFAERSRIKAYYQYWQYWNNYAYTQADFSILSLVFH